MQKSPELSIKIRIGRIFPFTVRGFAFFLLSVLITVLGYIRMDLASLLWGCAFFLISLYSFIGSHIVKHILSRFLFNTPESVNISVPYRGVFPGDNISLRLRIELPGVILPGFMINFLCRMHFPGRVPLVFNAELKRGINETFITKKGKYRGIYKSREVSVICRDLLKFTESAVNIEFSEAVVVYPFLAGHREMPDYSEEGGESSRYSVRKRRSDEFLEVRKYFPGDDVRKLNWKVFAHTGELFLRVGEETPPPLSEILFILDSGLNTGVPEELRADYLDAIVEECGLNIMELISTGAEVLFLSHGAEQAVPVNPEKSEYLLRMLSGVTWQRNPEKVNFPVRKNMHVVIFSSPGSPSLEYYVKSSVNRGWAATIYFKTLIFNKLEKRGFKDFIFRTGSKGPTKYGRANYNLKQAEKAFKEVLNTELSKYGKFRGTFRGADKDSNRGSRFKKGRVNAYKI